MRNLGLATLMSTLMVFATVAIAGPSAATTAYPPIPHRSIQAPPSCLGPAPRTPIPADQIKADLARITTLAGRRIYSMGSCDNGTIQLWLAPASERLAQRIRATFGPGVRIGIGLTTWNARPGRSPRCGVLPQSSGAALGYAATLELQSRTVSVGSNLGGHVALRATGALGVQADTPYPIEVVITKPRTRRVVGVFAGPTTGIALATPIGPGHSGSIDIIGGTARCDGGIGSALPPGHYDAVAEFSGIDVNGIGSVPPGSPATRYFTQFVPIQIVR